MQKSNSWGCQENADGGDVARCRRISSQPHFRGGVGNSKTAAPQKRLNGVGAQSRIGWKATRMWVTVSGGPAPNHWLSFFNDGQSLLWLSVVLEMNVFQNDDFFKDGQSLLWLSVVFLQRRSVALLAVGCPRNECPSEWRFLQRRSVASLAVGCLSSKTVSRSSGCRLSSKWMSFRMTIRCILRVVEFWLFRMYGATCYCGWKTHSGSHSLPCICTSFRFSLVNWKFKYRYTDYKTENVWNWKRTDTKNDTYNSVGRLERCPFRNDCYKRVLCFPVFPWLAHTHTDPRSPFSPSPPPSHSPQSSLDEREWGNIGNEVQTTNENEHGAPVFLIPVAFY